MRLEWDLEKARHNLTKHGVSFEEAATAFADPLSITRFDPDHSEDEDRYLLLGATQEFMRATKKPRPESDELRPAADQALSPTGLRPAG